MSSDRSQDQNRQLIDALTGKIMPQRRQPGYYPGYSTLSQRKFWDVTTREMIEKRVRDVPPIRFFRAEEIPVITAICDRILPQDDRIPESRIPIVNQLDERLFENKIDGYRFESMPSDREAYRLGIQAVDETAKAIHGAPFVELDPIKQDLVLKSIHDSKKLAAQEIWERMSISHFWSMLVTDCVKAYYSHPWAWDEVGFGGPAYPRAYTRLENGLPEPWEVDEVRYEWAAPTTSLSDIFEPGEASEQQSHPAQGGTH